MPGWILDRKKTILNRLKTVTNNDKILQYFQDKSGLSESEIWEIFLHIENMYAGKPHKAYYEQIIKMLGTKYDQCMMIGNDVNMDMAARNSDILTFYLQTDPGEPQINIENADFSGDFNKLCFILGLTELTFPPENNNLFPIRLQFILIRNDIGHYNFICKFPLFSDSILKFEAKIYGFK